MAFQTSTANSNGRSSNSYSNNLANKAAAPAPVRAKGESINLGGAYEGKPGSKLVLKTGKTKESITIPAGYVLKVFQKGGKSKNGKDLPPFEIVAQKPTVRQDQ